jgi:two-component system sensor histidine kinase VicK
VQNILAKHIKSEDKQQLQQMAIETRNLPAEDIQRIGKLSSDGVFIFDLQSKQFAFLNAAILKILEINKKVLSQEPDLILQAIIDQDRDYVKMRFSELMDNESIEDLQVRLKQSTSEKVVSLNCYVTSDKLRIIGFVRDITKPKEHEDYLINYGARKDALLDSVSQRLSTPLNLSKFTVDLIEKAVTEKKYGKLNSHIKIIREVTGDCIRFISDFMREEHLVSPNIHTKTNRFDAMAKVLIVLEKLKASSPGKQFKFQTKTKHLFMNGDDVKFFQIVHNLLSNSIKFTEENGSIETTIKSYKSKFKLIVKDDGIGIPAELQPYIFEKNSRAARPGLKGEKSNGIGLYVVKRLTHLMGGKISFDSKENKGTRFVLELPRQR